MTGRRWVEPHLDQDLLGVYAPCPLFNIVPGPQNGLKGHWISVSLPKVTLDTFTFSAFRYYCGAGILKLGLSLAFQGHQGSDNDLKNPSSTTTLHIYVQFSVPGSKNLDTGL